MSGPMPLLAVAGRPILHSSSPLLFREFFRAAGIEAAYSRVAASSAEEALGIFRALGMRGMNLTSPFKESAALLVDELSADARVLGAVNCLVAREDGSVLGANTDPRGVIGGLAARGVVVAGKRCLVLGAGGAGKAAAYALASAGGVVVVANRTRRRADEVAALVGCVSAGLDELADIARQAEVIVSTLPSDALPDPSTWLPRTLREGGAPGPAILDADYKTGALARAGAERGLAVATGADWLVCQALPAYELFMGAQAPLGPEAPELAACFTTGNDRAKRRPIALTGLMGAGKTQTGRLLASLLGLPFVDADKEIEKEAGASVSAIFEREGEASFRARERRIIDRITSEPGRIVLATGGGAPAQADTARVLAERCLCVWLYVSPETAARRTRGGAARPLLGGASDGGEAKLRELWADRRGAYASLAELIVSTEGREAGAVAEVVHDEIDRIS